MHVGEQTQRREDCDRKSTEKILTRLQTRKAPVGHRPRHKREEADEAFNLDSPCERNIGGQDEAMEWY